MAIPLFPDTFRILTLTPEKMPHAWRLAELFHVEQNADFILHYGQRIRETAYPEPLRLSAVRGIWLDEYFPDRETFEADLAHYVTETAALSLAYDAAHAAHDAAEVAQNLAEIAALAAAGTPAEAAALEALEVATTVERASSIAEAIASSLLTNSQTLVDYYAGQITALALFIASLIPDEEISPWDGNPCPAKRALYSDILSTLFDLEEAPKLKDALDNVESAADSGDPDYRCAVRVLFRVTHSRMFSGVIHELEAIGWLNPLAP